ncbi:MAG: PilZ domain-containing protein [Thermodesulfobacteriota bacterium]
MGKAEVFVNQENMALFHCPHCGRMKHVSVLQFKDKKHSLQVKCACQQTFQVDLNFRKRYRKETSLPGYCCKAGADGGWPAGARKSNCTVVNVSMGGIGLRLHYAHSYAAGDLLLVDFTLDDRKQSRLQRRVIVRHVGENGYIGAEFSDSDQALYEKALGFYLMP